VFVDLHESGAPEAVATKDTAARDVGTSPPAVTVQGPELGLKGVAGAALLEGTKLGVACGLLKVQAGVQIVGPKG
jgi:hypothetical protein